MNPVVYFEIPVLDLDRACEFYSKVFEATFNRDVVDGYQMAFLSHLKIPSGLQVRL
jgi:predicted enzyme related to lactoylglutathione lyase